MQEIRDLVSSDPDPYQTDDAHVAVAVAVDFDVDTCDWTEAGQ